MKFFQKKTNAQKAADIVRNNELKTRGQLMASYNAASGVLAGFKVLKDSGRGFNYTVTEDGVNVRIKTNIQGRYGSSRLTVLAKPSGRLVMWYAMSIAWDHEEYIVKARSNGSATKKILTYASDPARRIVR